MKALRKIQKIKNNSITIEIPDGFSCNEVEVIVFPHEKIKKNDNALTEDWRKDFLSVSQWGKIEVEKVKSWKIQEL